MTGFHRLHSINPMGFQHQSPLWFKRILLKISIPHVYIIERKYFRFLARKFFGDFFNRWICVCVWLCVCVRDWLSSRKYITKGSNFADGERTRKIQKKCFWSSLGIFWKMLLRTVLVGRLNIIWHFWMFRCFVNA